MVSKSAPAASTHKVPKEFAQWFLKKTQAFQVKKGRSADDAKELAKNRLKALESGDADRLEEEMDKWKSETSKGSASEDVEEEEAEEKPAAKPKAKRAPTKKKIAENENGEAPAKPAAKRKRVNPEDIPTPTKRVTLNATTHFDKNGRMFFYNHKDETSSWAMSAHDFMIHFVPAMKELGYLTGGGGSSGKVSKKGSRKSKLHGYHVFVKEFKLEEGQLPDNNEKGKERIKLAAKAWKALTEAQKLPWKAKSEAMNASRLAAETEGAAAASADEETKKEDKKTPATKKSKKSEAEAKVAMKAEPELGYDW